MKARLIVAVACFLVACSGGGGGSSGPTLCAGANTTPPDLDADYAPVFVGVWNGLATISIDGVPQLSAPGYTNITADGMNKLQLRGDQESGVLSLVTSPSTFSIVCYTAVQKIGSCASVHETWSTGSGTLEGGILTVVADGVLEGCGEYHTVRQELTGATMGYAVTAGAVGLEEVRARAFDQALLAR